MSGRLPICGATLIAPNWVLTAAHCFLPLFKCKPPPTGELFSVKEKTGHIVVVCLGDHDYTKDTGVEENHQVDKMIFYPGHVGIKYQHDIALLRLKTKVKRKIHINFACLPTKNYYPPLHSFCYFVGWGSIYHRARPNDLRSKNILMEGKARVAGQNTCLLQTRGNAKQNHICTDDTYAMTCRGDSGGGLHCLDPQGKWIVAGIVASAPKNCSEGLRLYTNTGFYLDWIKNIIRDN